MLWRKHQHVYAPTLFLTRSELGATSPEAARTSLNSALCPLGPYRNRQQSVPAHSDAKAAGSILAGAAVDSSTWYGDARKGTGHPAH